jgi:hypothetical protein
MHQAGEGPVALALSAAGDHRRSATAAARGHSVCCRSDVSTVSPHCSTPPPSTSRHCASLNPSHGSRMYMVSQRSSSPPVSHTRAVSSGSLCVCARPPNEKAVRAHRPVYQLPTPTPRAMDHTQRYPLAVASDMSKRPSPPPTRYQNHRSSTCGGEGLA